jgi:Flp pilus assembly protein TadG
MRKVGGFGRLGARFKRNRGGNFGLMMAVTAPLLVLASGYGLNIAQISITKSNLLAALDSAVTSTARDLTTGVITKDDAQGVVEAFLLANGQRAYAEEGKLTLDKVEIDPVARTVEAKASVELDLAFALFGAANHQKISVESAAIYSDRKIEIAMALDLTGSMKKSGSVDKMGDLQTAARNAVNLLLSGKNIDDRVRVALVPYANSVNVGPTIAYKSVYIEKSKSDRGRTVPNTNLLNLVSGLLRPDNCATERKGTEAYSDAGPEKVMVNRDFFLSEFAKGYYDPNSRTNFSASRACPSATIVPLTSDAKTLTDTIGKFAAEGGTGGHIGIQWVWYMLSDKWKDVVGSAAEAGPYDAEKVGKFAILMTDGEFNLGFDGANEVYEAYGSAAAARSIPRAKRLCAEMRKVGISVFTIGFKLPNNAARELMKDCASPSTSSIDFYYDTSSGTELDQAFKAIVRNIESLALTK